MTDFPTYDNIVINKLKAWNRLNTYWNVKALFGDEAGKNYLEQFPRKDKLQILILGTYIVKKGYETTRREIFKDLNG